MSNVQSYNALIDRFKAFASGHFILKRFSHGQIEVSDLEKFGEYPFMHVVPSNVTYAKGMKTFSFQIVLADMPRDKEDKPEYQREVLSDLQRIAEDLIAEITNHRVLFGDLITVNNVSLEPFLEEFQHTLTGWTVSLDLLVPYYWDACSIPAEWNDFFESSTGGTGSILTFIDSITRDENGNVSLVNDEAEPSPNYYYGTNDEGVRGWYLLTDEVGLTCVTLPACQTIIDIEAAIDDLQEEILLKANTADISAVGFSNDYNDLDNKPTIPAAQIQSDWNQSNNTALDFIKNKPTIPASGLPAGGTAGQILTKVDATDYNATWQENFADWTSVVKHTVKNNGLSGTITKGTAVYVTGSNGTNMLVGRASNTSEATSSKTMGLMQSDITTTGGNQTGFVITEGLLGGLNTAGQTAGDPVWLGVNGALIYGLANKPYAPAHLVFIGIVTKVSAGNGEIFVKVQNGFELKEIHDVDIISTTPINGHLLGFDGTLWVNKTVASWLGFTPVTEARTLTINGTTQDLSADRTFTIASNPGTVTSVAALTLGTTGTDLSSTVANGTSTPVITLNVPTASAANRGALSAADWSTFNGKFTLPSLTSGSVLFSNGTTIAQSNANFFWDNTNSRLGIGTASPAYRLDVTGNSRFLNDLIVGNTTASPNLQLGPPLSGNYGATLKMFGYNSSFKNWEFSVGLRGQNFNITPSTTDGGSTFTTPAFSIATTGNVQIGTTTDAGYKLDVNGTARVTGVLTLSNTVNGNNSNWNVCGASYFNAIATNPSGVGGVYLYGQTITNTTSQKLINLTPTYNQTSGTAANTDIFLNRTTTAVGSGTQLLMDLQHNSASIFSVSTSGAVQINSTTQGFLFPRMTTTQKNAIASPLAGLVVYDTTLGKLCVRGASAWETITSV